MPAILVVDDDRDTCQNMLDLLSDYGYDVTLAGDGESALANANATAYDVGLIDLRMPGIDGLTLCRLLRQMQPSMALMIITGFLSSDLDERALAAGVLHVLQKPLDVPQLFEIVARNTDAANLPRRQIGPGADQPRA